VVDQEVDVGVSVADSEVKAAVGDVDAVVVVVEAVDADVARLKTRNGFQ